MSNPDDITQAGIVCQNIRLNVSDYSSLDPAPYIDHIRELKAKVLWEVPLFQRTLCLRSTLIIRRILILQQPDRRLPIPPKMFIRTRSCVFLPV